MTSTWRAATAPSRQPRRRLLASPGAPIVLLRAAGELLPDAVAPGLDRLGVMLAHTPLHHLMLRRMARPVVMTSGNLSGLPPCTENSDARIRLAGVAAFALMHDRPIAHRIDDTVTRVDLGRARLLRRGRGVAPSGVKLPAGFSTQARVLAMGGDQKNAFCLVQDGQAVLGQHLGDLGDAAIRDDAARHLSRWLALYGHAPQAVAVDCHPDYAATRNGQEFAGRAGLPVIEVQHHHAHIAACMVENAWPLDGGPVLGIALDGAGWGPDGTVWGGEVLACTYLGYERLGCLKPVRLLGGDRAAREPWRNAYAHLMAEMGWAELAMNFADLPLIARLSALPRPTLDAMLATGRHAPLASSCGRLFDAAAALCGLAWGEQDHEGQAAMAFEAAIDPAALREPDDLAYPFAVPRLGGRGMPYVEPLGAWRALLGDLLLDTPVGVIAARFHRGLARAIVALAVKVSGDERRYGTAALSGGCFQNATLFGLVHQGLQAAGFDVLSQCRVPCNDGGLALGQAAIALALAGTLQGLATARTARRCRMCLGIPGRIVAIADPARKLATMEVCGVRREINVACIAPADLPLEALLGTWALVHVGFAMSRIDEAEAARTLEVLTMLGEAQAELDAMRVTAR